MFRKIELDRPTLLLDEVDTIFGPKAPPTYEGLRALLNAGRRRGTTVPRCVGEGTRMTVRDFPVYCPKVFAGIGKALPDTVLDRSIVLHMVRNPLQTDHRIRSMPIRQNAACRSLKTLMPISQNAVMPISFRPTSVSVIGMGVFGPA